MIQTWASCTLIALQPGVQPIMAFDMQECTILPQFGAGRTHGHPNLE